MALPMIENRDLNLVKEEISEWASEHDRDGLIEMVLEEHREVIDQELKPNQRKSKVLRRHYVKKLVNGVLQGDIDLAVDAIKESDLEEKEYLLDLAEGIYLDDTTAVHTILRSAPE